MADICPQFRLVGRSYLLFVLMPEPPVAVWLAGLDAWIQSSAGYLDGKPILLDLSKLPLAKPELAVLVDELKARKIPVIAVEGVDAEMLGPELPPLVSRVGANSESVACDIEDLDPAAQAPKDSAGPNSLLIDTAVRSGQRIHFENGDVTVLGPVSSGAEILAGGSIHVYGELRGRVMAGVTGNRSARIFCQKFDAELVAINGLYTTVDDAPPHLCGRPVQAWRDQDSLLMTEII